MREFVLAGVHSSRVSSSFSPSFELKIRRTLAMFKGTQVSLYELHFLLEEHTEITYLDEVIISYQINNNN